MCGFVRGGWVSRGRGCLIGAWRRGFGFFFLPSFCHFQPIFWGFNVWGMRSGFHFAMCECEICHRYILSVCVELGGFGG